ncbi:hypothetical protein CI610_02154 [invertebrate metagenome]|uniref:Uncharacterized protein n=1 Tax=invertebrate metagenome TaxID=1711999 RepID=A0A2H9T6N2_9ZZZZ
MGSPCTEKNHISYADTVSRGASVFLDKNTDANIWLGKDNRSNGTAMDLSKANKDQSREQAETFYPHFFSVNKYPMSPYFNTMMPVPSYKSIGSKLDN